MCKRLLLACAHQAAITCDVRRQDSRQSSLHALTWQKHSPDQTITYQNIGGALPLAMIATEIFRPAPPRGLPVRQKLRLPWHAAPNLSNHPDRTRCIVMLGANHVTGVCLVSRQGKCDERTHGFRDRDRYKRSHGSKISKHPRDGRQYAGGQNLIIWRLKA